MFGMLKKLSAPRSLLFLLAGLAVLSLLGWLGWKVNQLRQPVDPTAEPILFEYCGADLVDFCVLSFGRDGDGNTIVNLFVPEKKFSAFYLNVIKATGESRFECDKSEDEPTSVYCIGGPVNLNERIEIRLLSKRGDQTLARGRFTITAFLISAPVSESQPTETGTPEAGITVIETPTSGIIFQGQAGSGVSSPADKNEPTPTPSVTPTVSASYPNYP